MFVSPVQAKAESTQLAQLIATALSTTQAWLLQEMEEDDAERRALTTKLMNECVPLAEKHALLQVRPIELPSRSGCPGLLHKGAK